MIRLVKKEKRENLYLLPVSQCKAFALPMSSKRATRSLTPIWYTMLYITLIITTNITKKYHKHTHETFTVALFLTTFKKLRSSTLSKPKRQVNAFSIMSSPTHEPCRRERCDKDTTSRAENKINQLFFIPPTRMSVGCDDCWFISTKEYDEVVFVYLQTA